MEDHGVVSLVYDMNSIQFGPGETAPPDPKRHLGVSISKSMVRIFGFSFLFIPSLFGFGLAVLIGAEILGIVEELV